MRRWLWIAVAGAASSGCSGGAQMQPVSSATASSASVSREAHEVVSRVADSPRALAVLGEEDRSPEDRAQDGPRQTADVLTYLDVKPGMTVVELASGGGYFTELLARSVGHEGRLFAENPPSLLAKRGLEEAWKTRLSRPAGARVVRLDEEMGTPLPTHALDLVFVSDDLGDLAAQGVAPGGAAIVAWNSLQSGGRFVVVEPAQANGEPRPETIEAIERCGFRFASEGRFFRDGSRLVATFVKP